MSFLKRFRKQEVVAEAILPVAPSAPAKATGFVPPPPRPAIEVSSDPRIARLEQRRVAIENAIEQVERSSDPNSPYQQRIEVLTATLDSIEAEISAASTLERRALPALPPEPIEQIEVTLDPAPKVTFRIGPEHFEYAEEIDWAERGNQIVRGDLLPVSGAAGPLIPSTIEGSTRESLMTHLDHSLFAFATDARDRAVEGRPQVEGATLADLAKPCPKCGDWELWGGVCLRCLEHEARLRELNAERSRVLDERTSEIEDRQRQMEELPIQRRRLAQTIADIQALQS